ncbi:MAG TPA: AarF/UbiB family protein [Thermoanaerobaculia bacterium]|nr:AarF/UbiB family protein [Thermoanaerobaculia bacterium]
MQRIDPHRYRKLRRFVARTFVHVLWWDVLLNQPLLRRFRRAPVERWQGIARRYRALAVGMGGVLIKLGQFLSVRVDLLPPEVIGELSGLQDEVPPEPFADIVRQVEADFGRPLREVFELLSPEPVGSASLAQVHPALLPTGEKVVVKVLRPGIDVLVETDLAAAGLAIRLLRFSRRVRRRVDLRRLADEFSSTTRRELDLAAEGKNAERFAKDFAGDSRVCVPKVYWEWSAGRTMTMEDVGYLKISDLEALARAGIRRPEVARVLYRVYMQQIFVHNFVHADPHPGNLFVKPLAGPGELDFRPGDAVPYLPDRGFQLVFVDFGMVAAIPPRLRGALREYVIALGTRDAARIVQAYLAAGVLLPGADLKRLEEVHRVLFERFWGVRIGQMRDVALSEAAYFLREYRDLLYDAPFQLQVDLLFVSRAVGLLSGMATTLDPEFDPWAETRPFAEGLARDELKRNWREWLEEAVVEGRALLGLPRRLEEVLTRAERGELEVQTALAPETRRALDRLERATHRLTWSILAAALLLGAALLHVNLPGGPWARWLAGLGAAAFLWGTITKS